MTLQKMTLKMMISYLKDKKVISIYIIIFKTNNIEDLCRIFKSMNISYTVNYLQCRQLG